MSSQNPPLDGGRATAASDAALKAAMHRLFDGQIPNYGSYNLVCAAEAGGTVDLATGAFPGAPAPLGMVLGYRRHPAELVIAPFNRRTLAPTGRPSTIDVTNLAYAEEAAPGAFDIGTNMGRIFCFTVRSRCVLDRPDDTAPSTAAAPRIIEQGEDADDFAAFMRDLTRL